MKRQSNLAVHASLVEQYRNPRETKSPQRMALDNYYMKREAVKLKRLDFVLNCSILGLLLVGAALVVLLAVL